MIRRVAEETCNKSRWIMPRPAFRSIGLSIRRKRRSLCCGCKTISTSRRENMARVVRLVQLFCRALQLMLATYCERRLPPNRQLVALILERFGDELRMNSSQLD